MAMGASKEREYRICTTRLDRSALDYENEILARDFIPMGEDDDGWELLSVSPLEKESDHDYITLVALIARICDAEESDTHEASPRIEEVVPPQETHNLDRKEKVLYGYEESYEKKERRLENCKLGGGLLLLMSLIPLVLPLEECFTWERGFVLAFCDWDAAIKVHFGFLFLGLPFFLYGWLASNPILRVRGEITLCQLARFLKRAESDKRFTITSEFNSDGPWGDNRLVLLVRDRTESPEKFHGRMEFRVTEGGRLYKYFP